MRSELRESLISKFFGNLHSSCEEGDDERFGLLISNLSALVKTLRHEDFSAFHQFSFLVSLYFSIETALKDFPHLDFRSKLPRVEDLEKVLKVYDFIKDKIVDELLEGSIGFSNLSTEEQIYCKCYQAIDVCIYALEKEYKDTIPSAKTIENIVNVFYKAIGDVNNETLKSDVIRVLVSTLCTSLNIKQMLHLIRSLSGPLLDSIRIEFINVLVDRNEIKSAAAIINTIDDTEVREELLQALADEFKLTSSLGSEEASELESSSEEEDPFEIWSSSESEDSFEEI